MRLGTSAFTNRAGREVFNKWYAYADERLMSMQLGQGVAKLRQASPSAGASVSARARGLGFSHQCAM